MTGLSATSVAFVLSLFETGLAAVRSLGRVGIPVIGLDSNPHMPGFKSRYCTPKLCPNPVHQPDELLRFLLEEGERLAKPGILIPASDAFVLFVARYREDLHRFFRFALPAENVLEAMVNKRKQYELAEQVGMPYAQTFYPETREDVQRIKDRVDYPAIIKPYYSHLWCDRFGGVKGVFKVHTAQELTTRFEEILPTGLQVLVQSVILGPNTNHFKVCAYMSQSGEPLAVFTLRKIRQYPTEFGVGTLVESLAYPELAELGLKFFSNIGYRGIGSIEFKKDERDGKLKMIELNPRLWLQNSQATDCGMNFPLIEYLDLTGHTPPPQRTFKTGVKWWDARNDFYAFWSYRRQGTLSLWPWIGSWIGSKSFATFAWDDLGPFLRANDFGSVLRNLPRYLLLLLMGMDRGHMRRGVYSD